METVVTGRSQWAPWCRWMPRPLLFVAITGFLLLYVPLYIVCMIVVKTFFVFVDIGVITKDMYKGVWNIDKPLPYLMRVNLADLEVVEEP